MGPLCARSWDCIPSSVCVSDLTCSRLLEIRGFPSVSCPSSLMRSIPIVGDSSCTITAWMRGEVERVAEAKNKFGEGRSRYVARSRSVRLPTGRNVLGAEISAVIMISFNKGWRQLLDCFVVERGTRLPSEQLVYRLTSRTTSNPRLRVASKVVGCSRHSRKSFPAEGRRSRGFKLHSGARRICTCRSAQRKCRGKRGGRDCRRQATNWQTVLLLSTAGWTEKRPDRVGTIPQSAGYAMI